MTDEEFYEKLTPYLEKLKNMSVDELASYKEKLMQKAVENKVVQNFLYSLFCILQALMGCKLATLGKLANALDVDVTEIIEDLDTKKE